MSRKQLTPVDMGGNKVISLATPTVGTDAANKDYVDSKAGGGISGQATINFGVSSIEDSIATVTVSLSSVLSSSIVIVSPSGKTTADHDPDDYQWDNITGYASNIVNGVSFDITGVAPNGTWGQYVMNYMVN